MNDYISKPIEEKKLLGILHRWAKDLNKLHETEAEAQYQQHPTIAADWDSERLELLKGSDGNQDFFQELIETFCTTGYKYMTSLKNNMEQNDKESLRKNVHALKGMSLSIGATRIAKLSLEMEDILRENKFISPEKLALLDQAFTESVIFLKTRCISLKN
jgi:HPt (histidine-containing phosphotransfer) domain-containing protein